MKKIIVCLFLLFSNTYIVCADTVILGGDSIGIVGEYIGLYISGTYTFTYHNKTYNNETYIKPNDILIEINNYRIDTIEDLNSIIKQYDGLQLLDVTLLRNQKEIHTNMYILNNSNKITCGLYIKDQITGIGTMTYYHPETKIFACLGHYISNSNNDSIQRGTIYNSSINSIQKAQNNLTGEKIGTIHYNQIIGTINKNHMIGVYGTYNTIYKNKTYIETADYKDIKIGKAYINTCIKNQNIQKFEIKITKVKKNKIEFTVIDPQLIEYCGGIIHGMSGSPIIQDGKLIGAVTHVLVNDPTRGYGIFIENMLEAAG